MKVCFFGLGSIGNRHLTNLNKVAEEENIELDIHAFRSKKDSVEFKGLNKEIYNEEELHNDYDITFITNPTSKHFSTIKKMVTRTKNMFIEKPIFDSIDYEINDVGFGEGIYYIAAPLRYSNVIKKLKKIVKNYRIYSIRAICSSYLPDWRPGKDYRKVYSSKKELGGGVSIDLIHEWDYLTYLFGFPKRVFNLQGKFSHLEINSEDLSVYIAEYQDKLLELHLDYFGRTPRREIEIFTKEGLIKGDFINKQVVLSDGKIIELPNKDIYLEEMRNFIGMVMGKKKNTNPPEYAYRVLKLIKESENESSYNNMW